MLIVMNTDGTMDSTYADGEGQMAMLTALYPDRTIQQADGPPVSPRMEQNGIMVARPVPADARVMAVGGQPPVVVVNKVDLFRRTSEDEADQIMAALSQTSNRLQAIFNAAVTYRSDAPEWSILHDTAVGLFGVDRANQLLAPSV